MPRQAAAAQGFAANGSTRSLLKPPDDLDQLERTEFVALITGAPPSHFLPSDVPLLAAYAKAIVAERVAAGELAAAYVVSSPNGDRPSPWLPIWQAKVRSLTTLARMLGLSPGGRLPSKPTDEPKVSVYEKMALEHARNERN
jgi:phage terminase small subunit